MAAHVAVKPVAETAVALVANGAGETVIAVIEFEFKEDPEAFTALTRYLYVVPGVRDVTEMVVPATLRLSKPVTLETKLLEDTSRLYSVAPVIAPQLAVNETSVMEVAEAATGVAGKTRTEMILESVDVPDVFTALTRYL